MKMKVTKIYSVFTLIFALFINQPAYSTEVVPAVDISVDGNLYLDFSVFSEYDFFAPSGIVSFDSQRTFFYPASRTPEITDIAGLNIYSSVFLPFDPVGDTLFFGSTPVMDATFLATENIYIGDYSVLAEYAITTVPVPAAFWFFVSGLTVLLGGTV